MKDHIDRYFQVAKKLSVDVDIVQKVVESEFEFTSLAVKEGLDMPIYLQFLGRFLVRPGRREYIKNKREILKKVRSYYAKKK